MLEGKMLTVCEIVHNLYMELGQEPQLRGHPLLKYAWQVTEVNRGLLRAIGTGKMEGVKEIP